MRPLLPSLLLSLLLSACGSSSRTPALLRVPDHPEWRLRPEPAAGPWGGGAPRPR